MEVIRSDRLTRNTELIRSYFKKVKNTTITTTDITIYIPARYTSIGLATISSVVETLMMYAIVDKQGNYGVCIAPIIGKLIPSSPAYNVLIDGVEYIALPFEAGQTVIANNTMLCNDSFIYNIFQEFFINGKVPWFFGYEDLSNLLLEAKKYASSSTGDNPIIIEVLTSVMARVANNKKVFYKSVIKSKDDLNKIKPSYIGVSDRYYNFDTTVGKIVGGYFKEGILNAVVEQETETSKVSEKLRD